MRSRPAASLSFTFAFLLTTVITACGSSPGTLMTLAPRTPAGSESFTPVFSPPGVPAPLELKTESGDPLQARLWRTETSQNRLDGQVGILFVSGNVDAPFVEPVDGIYVRLANAYAERGVVSLFINYRSAGDLEPSLADAKAGADYLRKIGIRRMALVGWSFGGAIITTLAPQVPEVVTVVGISAQSRDTEPVANFSRQSLLLLHSQEDDNVPFMAAGQILDEAPSTIHKELHAFETGDHYLTGMANLVDPIVKSWLETELRL